MSHLHGEKRVHWYFSTFLLRVDKAFPPEAIGERNIGRDNWKKIVLVFPCVFSDESQTCDFERIVELMGAEDVRDWQYIPSILVISIVRSMVNYDGSQIISDRAIVTVPA